MKMKGLEKAVRSQGEHALIDISVSPNAKHDEIGDVDPWRGRLGVKIKALPVEGKANKAIVSFFLDVFHVKEADVSIVSGEKSGQKTIKVGLPAQDVIRILKEK